MWKKIQTKNINKEKTYQIQSINVNEYLKMLYYLLTTEYF